MNSPRIFAVAGVLKTRAREVGVPADLLRQARDAATLALDDNRSAAVAIQAGYAVLRTYQQAHGSIA